MPTFLRGGSRRLRQILINLGTNAIKFTAGRKSRSRSSDIPKATDHIKVLFEVGIRIGIPQNQIGRCSTAFQRFGRPRRTRRSAERGWVLAISNPGRAKWAEIGVTSAGPGIDVLFTAVFGNSPIAASGRKLPTDLRGVRILAVATNATNRLISRSSWGSWGVGMPRPKTPAWRWSCFAPRGRGRSLRITITDMQMRIWNGEALAEPSRPIRLATPGW